MRQKTGPVIKKVTLVFEDHSKTGGKGATGQLGEETIEFAEHVSRFPTFRIKRAISRLDPFQALIGFRHRACDGEVVGLPFNDETIPAGWEGKLRVLGANYGRITPHRRWAWPRRAEVVAGAGA